MLFVQKGNDQDALWTELCELYLQGKLKGVPSLKTSTMKKNPLAKEDKNGVIIVYCGPCDEEETMKEYGKIMLK